MPEQIARTRRRPHDGGRRNDARHHPHGPDPGGGRRSRSRWSGCSVPFSPRPPVLLRRRRRPTRRRRHRRPVPALGLGLNLLGLSVKVNVLPLNLTHLGRGQPVVVRPYARGDADEAGAPAGHAPRRGTRAERRRVPLRTVRRPRPAQPAVQRWSRMPRADDDTDDAHVAAVGHQVRRAPEGQGSGRAPVGQESAAPHGRGRVDSADRRHCPGRRRDGPAEWAARRPPGLNHPCRRCGW